MQASTTPARTIFFGSPRSASGAMVNCTINDARKPEAAMYPRPASENPYLSCRSLSAGKIMLFDTGTPKPHTSSGPMPMVKRDSAVSLTVILSSCRAAGIEGWRC